MKKQAEVLVVFFFVGVLLAIAGVVNPVPTLYGTSLVVVVPAALILAIGMYLIKRSTYADLTGKIGLFMVLYGPVLFTGDSHR